MRGSVNRGRFEVKLLLTGATVIDPSQDIEGTYDLLVENGIITRLARRIDIRNLSDVRVYDLSGLYVVPGLIDMHVHYRDPGFPDKETVITGAEAAAAGGFTTVVCMPNTDPAADSVQTVQYITAEGAKTPITVLVMAAITRNLAGEELTPFAELKEAGIAGISDDGKSVMNSEVMYRALREAAQLDLLVSVHCEDAQLTREKTVHRGAVSAQLGYSGVPSSAEEIIIARDLLLAGETGARVHIQHISTRRGVEMVRQAKAAGLQVSAEAAPHHFSLTDEAVLQRGTDAKMYPPLRTDDDVEAVIAGLADGTIDVIADDHAPHTPAEKAAALPEAPNGVIGLETTLAVTLSRLVHTGRLSLRSAVARLTAHPARLLQIDRGTLAVGKPADITVIDLHGEWTVDRARFRSKARNTPFDGMRLKGRAVMTIAGGKVVYELPGGTVNKRDRGTG